MTALQELRALILADLDVLFRRLYLLLVNLRAHGRGLIQTVANFDLANAIDKFVEELRIHALLHDNSARRGAALASRAETSPDRAIDRKINVGVVENNNCVLAAHFERAVLEGARSRLANDAANFARAGKGNCAHVIV